MIEREREREQTPQSNLPPQTPHNPKLPNSSLSLEQLKAQIKSQHNLSESEFAAIIVLVSDKEVLAQISLLLGAVREAQENIKWISLVDSSYEVLVSYRETQEASKKRAYEAVNSYQNQVDRLITDLATLRKLISDCLAEIVSSQSEEELNEFYKVAKNLEHYQQSENQQVIDNHEKRIRTALKIENQTAAHEVEKNLAQKLRTVINGDTEKEVLLLLQKELEEFQTTTSESEKREFYETHQKVINGTLSEIKQELTRRNHSEKGPQLPQPRTRSEKQNPDSPSSNLTLIVSLGIIGGVIVLVPFLIYWRRRKKLKLLNN